MPKRCFLTGKNVSTGNNVSHANNRTRRTFDVNLHWHRFWVPAQNRFVRLRVSSSALRTIRKNGIERYLGLEQQ